MIQKIEPINCVQCHREMKHTYGNDKIDFPFCSFPDCPNYGLLQTEIYPQDFEGTDKTDINDK